MSHRSADAYPRRSSGDDRRGSDPRDRRHDSYSKPGSDAYKDERRRRDTDNSARERRNPPDSPHNHPSANAAKPNSPAIPPRPEHGSSSRTLSASRSPTDGGGLDGISVRERFVILYKKHDVAVTELARLKAELDPLEKVAKQRQAEYERSRVKHAEFPSVPEIQNMHRLRYTELVQALTAQIKKAQEEVDGTLAMIAHTVFDRLAQVREPDNQAAVSSTSPHLCEVSKKQAEEISELKTKIRRIEAEHSQEKNAFEAERATWRQELEGMKEEMRRMRTIKDEMKEEMQQQLQSIRLEFEERCAKQHQSQQNEIRSQLSKHEDEVRRAVGEQLLAQRVTSSNAVSNGEISALQSNISDLSERVDQLIGQFTQHTEETVSLRTSVEECSKKVNDQAQVVNGLETKFSDLDLQDLIGLADMSLRFPPLERQLQGVQPQMKALSDKVQQMVSRMVTLTGGMVDQLRHTVDEIQKTIADQGGRIRALEDVSPSSSRLGAMGGFATGESTNADVVSIKGDFDSTKAEVERLTQEYSRLSEQVNRVKKDVASAQSVNGELESVRHQILVLDSQFGNLSTKALAEHIIGHLEQVMVYPNARQLAADFDSLKTLVDHLVSRIDSLEGKGEGSTSSVNGRFLVGHNELCGNGIGQKRKRADFELNGAEHPATNGAG